MCSRHLNLYEDVHFSQRWKKGVEMKKKWIWRQGERRQQSINAWPPVLLAEDVQVDWGGLSQSLEDFVDILNIQPLLRLPLPAPQHDIINLFWADSGSLQDAALGDALNDLRKQE